VSPHPSPSGPRALAALAIVALSASQAAPRFELLSRQGDGLTLETRATPGTDFPELRVRAHCTVAPSVVAEVVWAQGPGPEARYLERRDVLSSEANARVERHLIQAPVLGRRESILRFTRQVNEQGSIAIDFASGPLPEGVPSQAPPTYLVRGAWRFTGDQAGGTLVEFRSVSDPGGLPAFLAVGAARELAMAQVRDAIRRSAQAPVVVAR
jgi:hypothetical protein